VPVPARATSTIDCRRRCPPQAPEFVRNVTAMMMAGRGDELPVSALPVDGTYPSGTTQWEKRNISDFVPIWEPDICIQCGNCSLVCPHGVIRSKFYNEASSGGAPEAFKTAPIDARGFPDIRYTLQVYTEDCTGCGLCVEVCPAKSKEQVGARRSTWRKGADGGARKPISDFFETLPERPLPGGFLDRAGVQFLEPLFEFSGACAGCGETPYVKLLSQLFGDRLMVANATGCSSIYGGNLPTTPWSVNSEGRGPAWSNSLFEDNAEFGLGFRLTADMQLTYSNCCWTLGPRDRRGAGRRSSTRRRSPRSRSAASSGTAGRRTQAALAPSNDPRAQTVALHRRPPGPAQRLDRRRRRLGLRHRLRRPGPRAGQRPQRQHPGARHRGLLQHRRPNVEVHPAGRGGQVRGGRQAGGQEGPGLQAIAYGNVYVGRIAMGANPQQTLLAFREAEAYPGPSLILAYSHCIAHGINMQRGLDQQHLAVESGHWPLVRFNPAVRESSENPFVAAPPSSRNSNNQGGAAASVQRVGAACDPLPHVEGTKDGFKNHLHGDGTASIPSWRLRRRCRGAWPTSNAWKMRARRP
jgi:pyruvate-ferredoxin/flavodoxin oxidoreductase